MSIGYEVNENVEQHFSNLFIMGMTLALIVVNILETAFMRTFWVVYIQSLQGGDLR